MTVYWLLLLPTALISYLLGCLDAMVLASNFVFHRNLRRLGRGNVWLSNFKRIYGVKGFVILVLIELIRDVIPPLLGGLLLSIKGHADAGRAFAGFCMIVGRLYPLPYEFKGGHAGLCLAVAAIFVDKSAGISALVVMALVLLLSRYQSLSAVVGAVVGLLVGAMVIEDQLLLRLVICMGAIVIFKHIPALVRIFTKKEEKLTGEVDISYKLDERF